MNRVAVLYATREGQTRKIAEFLGAQLRRSGLTVDVRDVGERAPATLEGYAGAVVAASVHMEKHEKEMVKFVREHRDELERIPTAFVSVSLSERGAEDPASTPERRAQFAADVKKVVDRFLGETSWHPDRIRPVAGALLYTHYNFLIRYILKQIAKKEGGSTDTTRDHDYTDWTALEAFAAELAQAFLAPAAQQQEAR